LHIYFQRLLITGSDWIARSEFVYIDLDLLNIGGSPEGEATHIVGQRISFERSGISGNTESEVV
jgi:hypothetical protein